MTFQELKPQYTEKWADLVVTDKDEDNSDAAVHVRIIKRNLERYKQCQRQSGLWWPIIACLHALEASFDFTAHLHNGDSLKRRTVNVPAGRPLIDGPWTWEQSAADAIAMKRYLQNELGDDIQTIEGCLYYLESYNGMGYQTGAGRNTTPPQSSPYLYAGTNQWTRGKYTSDGTFDRNAGSDQFGCAGILKALVEAGFVTFGSVPTKPENTSYVYVPATLPVTKNQLVRALQGLGELPKRIVTFEELQKAICNFQTKHSLVVDGDAGPKTLAAMTLALTLARANKSEPIKTDNSIAVLTRTDKKDSHGCYILHLKIGPTKYSVLSGQPYAQNFRLPSDPKSLPGCMEPLPQGAYKIGDITWADGKDNYDASQGSGLGAGFVPLSAMFVDNRSAFGIHVDSNSQSSWGTAGCVGAYSINDMKLIVAALREFDPKVLLVDWNLT
jgi:lysozyme family protein